MSQEGVSDKHQVASASLQLVGVDGKLASLALSLMQVQLGSHLESLPADSE